MSTPKIAVVGTTRAGKSVFITVLAKYLERPREGARLTPRGGSPKNTYVQIEEWWNELQAGNWLPATLPGTLIELNWDLVVNDKSIPLQMFDYAGETLTDLFTNTARDAEGTARQYFDQVRAVFESASVLLVLLNLESLIEHSVGRATETKATLIAAMTSFLNKIKAEKRDCRVCFVFTSYDRYESVIKQRWGSVQAFLEKEIPPLYYEVMDRNTGVRILAVAAVGETETRVEPNTGVATQYPKAGFKTKGFDQLVRWLVQATSEAKAQLDENATEIQKDEENNRFVAGLLQAWEQVQHSTQVEPIDRFLVAARAPFPHPQRPGVTALALKLQPVVDAANDARSALNAVTRAEWGKNAVSVLKAAALVVAVIVGGRFAVGIVNGLLKVVQEERLKAPEPALVPDKKWTMEYTCNTGVLDCWEHRATARVPIWNRGGAGNITVTVRFNGRAQSATHFFNADEKASVSLELSDLPNHAEPISGARLEYKATN